MKSGASLVRVDHLVRDALFHRSHLACAADETPV
jgi:hypothetical protein